jgi:flagellar basal-body rod protein FlgB
MATQGIDPVLAQALTATDLRTRVLASDVANANTPGFAAKDVTFAGALRQQLGLGPGPDPLAGVVVAAPGLMTANGNGVDMEQALVDLQETVTASQGIGQTLADHFQTQQNVITTLEGA